MSNHLSGQHSAYLKQHAENPIDWYPWGDEAFEKASPLFDEAMRRPIARTDYDDVEIEPEGYDE